LRLAWTPTGSFKIAGKTAVIAIKHVYHIFMKIELIIFSYSAMEKLLIDHKKVWKI
jgi:hypothetical protein